MSWWTYYRFLKIVRSPVLPWLKSAFIDFPSIAPLKNIWDYEAFLRAFLYVFPTFTTPLQVVQLLIERFMRVIEFTDCYDLRVRFAIIQVFKTWLQIDQGIDFTDPQTRSALLEFIDREAVGTLDGPLRKLQWQLEHARTSCFLGLIIPSETVTISPRRRWLPLN